MRENQKYFEMTLGIFWIFFLFFNIYIYIYIYNIIILLLNILGWAGPSRVGSILA